MEELSKKISEENLEIHKPLRRNRKKEHQAKKQRSYNDIFRTTFFMFHDEIKPKKTEEIELFLWEYNKNSNLPYKITIDKRKGNYERGEGYRYICRGCSREFIRERRIKIHCKNCKKLNT